MTAAAKRRGPPPRKPAEYTPEEVRDVSEAVYRLSLGAKEVADMIKKDQDQGQKLRGRAGSYDRITRFYMTVLLKKGV